MLARFAVVWGILGLWQIIDSSLVYNGCDKPNFMLENKNSDFNEFIQIVMIFIQI